MQTNLTEQELQQRFTFTSINLTQDHVVVVQRMLFSKLFSTNQLVKGKYFHRTIK